MPSLVAPATLADRGAALLLSLLVKLALLATLTAVTGGTEIAEDWDLHLAMGGDPIGMHGGRLPEYRQFPPLIGYLLAPGALLSGVTGTFAGLRLWFLAFDILGFALVLLALPPLTRRALALVWVMWTLVPLVPLTSFVMSQEEVIPMAFSAAALLALVKGRRTTAMALSVVGVAAGKIFMLFSLAGFGSAPRRLLRLGLVGAGIAAVSYGPFLAGMARVEAFAPENARWGASYPTLLDKLGLVIPEKFTVTGLSFLFAVAVFLIGHRRTLAAAERDPAGVYAGLFAILQLLFCNLFYHVNQEYFVLLAPAITLFYARRNQFGRAFAVFLALSWNWVANFFYGLEVAAERPYVPELFKRLNQAAPLDPVTLHTAALAVGVALNAWALVRVVRDYRDHCAAWPGEAGARRADRPVRAPGRYGRDAVSGSASA